MVDKWGLFQKLWQTEDTEAVITDASSANDFMVEDSILKFQAAAKEVTDIAATLSASRAEIDDLLIKLREAVTLAYNSTLEGKLGDAKSHLEKVVGL